MLVIMEYRDITALFQLFLDLETSRSRNVLQVDAAKALGDQGNGVDDGIYIFGIHTQRERVHTGKLFEQGTFALHNRHAGRRADIAKSQNRSSIRNNGYQIALAGVNVRQRLILRDQQARLCNTRSIGDGKFLRSCHLRTGDDLDLTFPLFVFFNCKLFLIHQFVLLKYVVKFYSILVQRKACVNQGKRNRSRYFYQS